MKVVDQKTVDRELKRIENEDKSDPRLTAEYCVDIFDFLRENEVSIINFLSAEKLILNYFFLLTQIIMQNYNSNILGLYIINRKNMLSMQHTWLISMKLIKVWESS